MTLLKLVCLNAPDTSYTRNKELTPGETYWGEYHEAKLGGSYGDCRIYDVYDADKNKMGQYFAIDFLTVQEYRDKRLSEVLF